jgi:hypothetical protein
MLLKSALGRGVGGSMGSTVDVRVWREHWQDEGDAAYLYRSLAAIEPDQKRSDVHRRLALGWRTRSRREARNLHREQHVVFNEAALYNVLGYPVLWRLRIGKRAR